MVPKLHNDFVDNAVEILKNDSRIFGIAAGGSYITGDMDEYSDLDLVVVFEDNYDEVIMGSRESIARSLGNLLASFTGEHVGEPRLLICLYGPECLHVDLKFVALGDVYKRVEEPYILWERNKCITESLINDEAKFPINSLQWIEDRFWIWVHYAATKIGRGEIFETIEFISFLRQTVIGPLILMNHGELPKGVRKIEFIAPDSAKLLEKTVPTYSEVSCTDSLRLIVQIYLQLREAFMTKDFVKRQEAEIYSLRYLDKIGKNIL